MAKDRVLPERDVAARMPATERYLHDPIFHALVHGMVNQLLVKNVTPAGLQDAVALAIKRFEIERQRREPHADIPANPVP